MRDNVKRKLSEIGIAGNVASEIVFDIFGKKVDGGIEGGLVDCTSSDEFDTALKVVVEKWDTLHDHGAKFVEYFLKDVIREAARADVRSVCGLGYPPKVYTQNANECMNRVIKAEENSSYSKKEVSLLPYVERIRNEIKRQQNEQFLAVLGRGQYRVTEEFTFLEVQERNFYSMTDGQKTSLRKKFFSIKVTETPSAHTKRPNETKALSISPEESGIIDVSFPILTGMFGRAATLVNNPSYIWKMPTTDTQDKPAFMVHSTSSDNPHRVMVCPKSGKVTCDKACVNWSTYSLCSHTLAVSENIERLKEFLTWFKKQKRVPNLTTITNINMPQNKGRKSGTRKRKGAANTTPTEGMPVVASRVVHSHINNLEPRIMRISRLV
ncbi:Hypothetical predicted protein [Paramuricea clavata]|uniref:Uncharacterized protein n=1 Tax=Paramuricea clavata TaxID=317549 RepID=A0A7D9H9P8_PARCT|nr:Hypothetical predicted protein [Paramuricea clavata]